MNKELVENLQYRRDVMRVIALITFLGGVSFSILNVYRGIYILAGLELAFALFSLMLWRVVPTTSNLTRWTFSYLCPCYLLIMYALIIPQTSSSMFVWILVIPLMSYLLLGRQLGFWISIVFIFLGIIAYHWRFIDDNNIFTLNIATSINVSLSAILAMSIAHVYELNREKNERRLLDLAGTDKLTGLANRMKLDDSFMHFSTLAKRHKLNFIIVLFDLDYFKKINDQYGHDVGDEALCYTANFLKKNIRDSDFLARVGGEEFSLFMTSSDTYEAHKRVDLIREKLAQQPLVNKTDKITINLSAGLATYGVDGESLEILMKSADKRLYLAKKNGRNCIVTTN